MRTVGEYLISHLDFKGRGSTQEFNLLTWTSESQQAAKPLPDFLRWTGEDGWEIGSHTVNQGIQANGVTWHYMQFKRPKSP